MQNIDTSSELQPKYLFTTKRFNKFSFPSTSSTQLNDDASTDEPNDDVTTLTRSMDTFLLFKKRLSSYSEQKSAHYHLLLAKGKLFDEIIKAENIFWTNKNHHQLRNNPQLSSFLSLIGSSKNIKFIHEYFNMIQFQKCCVLLQSRFEFEKNSHSGAVGLIGQSHGLDSNQELFLNDANEADERMLLYYCTICSLYPSLYVSTMPQSRLSLLNEPILDQSSKNLADDQQDDLLETTSEGLSDFVREIFKLNRLNYNEYQIKLMKKLLLKKSHPEILKEELLRQKYSLEHDKHPLYAKAKFQTSQSYEVWKQGMLKVVQSLIDNFSHINILVIHETSDGDKNSKFNLQLTKFVGYYDNLVEKFFKHLVCIQRYKLTINFKRLLKEFQLRFLIDPFHTLLIEMYGYIKYFKLNTVTINILSNYLNQIQSYLNVNKLEDGVFPFLMDDMKLLYNLIGKIEASICKIFEKFQYHFCEANSKDLHSLGYLIDQILSTNDLLNSNDTNDLFMHQIVDSFQSGLDKLYETTYKHLKEKQYAHVKTKINVNLAYSMLQFSRDQLNFYANHADSLFLKYFNMTKIVLESVYKNLMVSVKLLCEEHLDELNDSQKLNVNLLALAYRLNQFDVEFEKYLPSNEQEWRIYFIPQLLNWSQSIANICKKSICELFISSDDFTQVSMGEHTLFSMNLAPKQNLNATRLVSNKILLHSGVYESNNTSRASSVFRTAHYSAFKALECRSTISNSNVSSVITIRPHTSIPHNFTLKRSKSLDSIRNQTFKRYSRTRSKSITNIYRKSKDANIISYSRPKMPHRRNLKPNLNRSNATSELSSLFSKSKSIRFPCSSSLIDLLVLIIRFKHTIESLIFLVIPNTYSDEIFLDKKIDLCLLIYSSVYDFIDCYLNNICSLDICASNETLIFELFGKETIDNVFNENKNKDFLWGCRHVLPTSKYSCQFYINRNSKYISDLFEPISEEMCTRINNLNQLNEIFSYMCNQFTLTIKALRQDIAKFKRDKLISILVKKRIDLCIVSLIKKMNESIGRLSVKMRFLREKMKKIRNGLVDLMAHRFQLFCQKSIEMLLTDDLDLYSPKLRFKPLIDFLHSNFKMLKTTFYQSLFKRFLFRLWNLVVKDFDHILSKALFNDTLKKSTIDKHSQLIDILIQIFQQYECNKTYLRAKADKILFSLKLFSIESIDLIHLYYNLFDMEYQMSTENFNKQKSFLIADYSHLMQLKSKFGKVFNGKDFVDYLRKNPAPSDLKNDQNKRLDKDFALNYAQTLLDENLIEAVIQKKTSRGMPSFKVNRASLINNLATSKLMSTGKIFMATKLSKFKMNEHQISHLLENSLSKNKFLSNELEILFSKNTCKSNVQNHVVEDALKHGIDYEFIMQLLWKRIYDEPIVMKFISLRNSNYTHVLNDAYQETIQDYLLNQCNNNLEQQTFFPIL